jgi:hypothetical protein
MRTMDALALAQVFSVKGVHELCEYRSITVQTAVEHSSDPSQTPFAVEGPRWLVNGCCQMFAGFYKISPLWGAGENELNIQASWGGF